MGKYFFCGALVLALAASAFAQPDEGREELLQNILLDSALTAFSHRPLTMDTSLREMRKYREVSPQSINVLLDEVSSRLQASGCAVAAFEDDVATKVFFDIKFDGRGTVSTVGDLMSVVRKMAVCP